jgi:hypothetical protein
LKEAEWTFGVASLSLPSALGSVDTGNLTNSQAAEKSLGDGTGNVRVIPTEALG